MKKIFLLFLILLAVSLAGCKPQEGTASIPYSTATTEARPTPPLVLALPTESSVSIIPDCTVKTLSPTPGPTEESIFPPVTNSDWTKGSADARVTIIEYGDFQ